MPVPHRTAPVGWNCSGIMWRAARGQAETEEEQRAFSAFLHIRQGWAPCPPKKKPLLILCAGRGLAGFPLGFCQPSQRLLVAPSAATSWVALKTRQFTHGCLEKTESLSTELVKIFSLVFLWGCVARCPLSHIGEGNIQIPLFSL